MAGAPGTKLWPLSRKNKPKPPLSLLPCRASLLEETVKRLHPLISPAHVWVVGNADHLKQLRTALHHIPKAQIIGEPASRNTLATVALGASLIAKKDPDAVVLVLPADHWIGDKPSFHKAIREAVQASRLTDSYAVFGVPATFPSSSYGYLRSGRKISKSVYELKQF